MVETLKKFDMYRKGWEDRRRQALEDMRAVNVKGGQWNEAVRADRDNAGRPALEFNELHIPIQRVVNQARKDRPQPRITPGDNEATKLVADFLEQRLRHIQDASRADVAYDGAIDDAATGGFGFYEITREYTDQNSCSAKSKPTFNQEPRIKRILDPFTEYPDPNCVEPDYSDAKGWFSRWWIDRSEYKRQFKDRDPIPFESGKDDNWCREDQVCLAHHWWVEVTRREYVALEDGTQGYRDELTYKDAITGQDITDETGSPIPRTVDPDEIVNTRTVEIRQVWKDTIDGHRRLKSEKWPGNWIPKIPVLGREKVVDGKRILIGVVRFAVDAMKLKNAYLSGVADSIQDACLAPWLIPVGGAAGNKWRDCNRVKYPTLEYNAYDPNDPQKPLPPPTRNTWEAPVAALSEGANKMSDEIHRIVGYADQIQQPVNAPVSGTAVDKRNEQTDLANFHIEDNLIQSQQFCARVVLDLDFKLTDTPRILMGRKEDGSSIAMPVTMAPEDHQEGAPLPSVPGMEGVEHIRYDIGLYDVKVVAGTPSFEDKNSEEKIALGEFFQADPQQIPLYADVYFKKCGYTDLEERAKILLPPPLQAAINGTGAPQIPPEIQQQLVQKDAQIQQLIASQQALLLEKKAKIQEIQGRMAETELDINGKLKVQQAKVAGELVIQSHAHQHDAAKTMLSANMQATKHRMDMLHESELAPPPFDPNQQQPEAGAQ